MSAQKLELLQIVKLADQKKAKQAQADAFNGWKTRAPRLHKFPHIRDLASLIHTGRANNCKLNETYL